MMQVTTPMIDVAVRETACHSFSQTHTQPQPPSASEICLLRLTVQVLTYYFAV